jgi:fermentation-respiration switch protein FrsA (DUF1100 family)
MRRNIGFMSKGVCCAGWLYVPDNLQVGQKAPAVVMAHGFSGVKEALLPNFAERFMEAGFVTMLFDYRYLGESEGEPRSQIIWYEQIEDYRNAITWVSEQPEVDANRIGVWGTSYAGAHVLYVGAYDRRVKAVVSQISGGIDFWDLLLHVNGPQGLSRFLDLLTKDRIARYKTGQVNYIKVIAPPGELQALGDPEAYEFFENVASKVAPNWKNQVTMESLEKMLEYNVSVVLPRISPTPVLMVLGEKDTLIPIDMAKKGYERLREPKGLCLLDCGHFELYYLEPWFSQASGAAVDWFKKHLRSD